MNAFCSLKTVLRIVPVLIGLWILCSIALPQQHRVSKRKKPAAKPSHAVSYKRDVFPVIKTYCLPCHTEEQMNPSELYLDTYANMMKGGKHGKPLVPSKADSSLMVLKLGPNPPFGDPMPLKRKTPVPPDTVNIVRKWIDQGGKDN